MQHASDDEQDDRVVWTCAKNNDGEPGGRTAWHRRNGLFIPCPGFDWQAFDSPTKESPSAISKEHLAKLFDNGKRKLARKTAVEELEQTTGCKKTACYAALEGLEAVKSNLFAFAPAIKRRGVNPHLRRHPRQIIAAGFQKLFCHSELLFSVKSDWTRVTRHWVRGE